jgi:tRNA modification GTPase
MHTIFALSTPPGKSGVAVMRVSGPEAGATLKAFGVSLPTSRMATLATLRMADGSVLDKALVLYFAGPASFTGEDIVEYHIHGSRAVIAQMLQIFATLPGLRPAEPGEFTRRAFFNGKMDLTAAEGLADLIDADTQAQHKQAMRIMQGAGAAFYNQLRAGVLHSLAYLEAYIDFPDEDIPEHVLVEINNELQSITNLIEMQLGDKGTAEKVRDGITVAIIGPPNAGKSSLMNLLAGRDAAIVSHIAGTTRDVIEVQLDISGYSVIVSDTAGIRAHAGEIEQEGIRRSLVRANAADIRIMVLDGEAIAQAEHHNLADLVNNNTILLFNKADLGISALPMQLFGLTPIVISVKDRTGIGALMNELEVRIASALPAEASFITRARHRILLTAALGHLNRFKELGASGLELQCEELRRAATEIGKITGVIAVDEILGHIFSSFCIGK